MFTKTFKLTQITKFSTFHSNPCYTNKYSFNKISPSFVKRHFCSKQQEITKLDSTLPKQQEITKLNTASDILVEKYPWTYRLISASISFIQYSSVIALNDHLSNFSLVDIIANIGCIYSFGHLVGLTDTNSRDFINQTFLANSALIVIILFGYCYKLMNQSGEVEKNTINISPNKE